MYFYRNEKKNIGIFFVKWTKLVYNWIVLLLKFQNLLQIPHFGIVFIHQNEKKFPFYKECE